MIALTLALLALSAPSLARGFYLETFTMEDRGEAIALQQSALEAGLSARVVRRWRHGVGWGYAVVVEELPDRASADAAAEDMASRTRRGVSVYAVDPGAPPPRVEDLELPASSAPAPSADEALERIVRAHGGRGGGRARLEAYPTLSFRYDREIQLEQGLLRARHDWSRAGEDRRITVEVVDGPGQDLIGEVKGAAGGSARDAWLEIEGVRHQRDPDRTLEVLDAYGPEALLATALDLAETLAGLDPLRLEFTEQRCDGRRCYGLRQVASGGGGLELLVDAETWTVSSLVVSGPSGALGTRFYDWREIETGLVIPSLVRTERNGDFQEELRVIQLELSPGTEPGADVP